MSDEYSKEAILEILMTRDGMSRDEALEVFKEARARVHDGEDPEEVCAEEFGLEPDYIFALYSL